MKQGAPWNADVELTRGCNKMCEFCGIRTIQERPGNYQYMGPACAKEVAFSMARLNPKMRIEFAGHGEPLLNPNHLDIIATFRRYMPKAQLLVTTNGATLRKRMSQRVGALFAAGVNIIILDTYEPERFALQAEAHRLKHRYRVMDYYTECLPQKWSPWANHNGKAHETLVVMDDLAVRNGDSKTRVVDNRAGNQAAGPRPRLELKRVCTLPFRSVFVTHEGLVLLCCMDWRREFVAGNIREQGAGAVWYGPELAAARSTLFAKRRSFAPCCFCDRRPGDRVGLLPKHPPPTPSQVLYLKGQV